MDDKPNAAPFKQFNWTCTCEQCASKRHATPPRPEDMHKYADLIAERTRVGRKPEKPRKKPRRMPGSNDFF